ncbi:hypothetical protein [Lacrimispora saccharolytica]|uniref:hypothetical protein n=1 Tax=Lacrimispora saccharolytica TaxID=84030 RepID=UPI0002EF5D62|nr:hypothetical protein [Lacrimispora saccharolytica]
MVVLEVEMYYNSCDKQSEQWTAGKQMRRYLWPLIDRDLLGKRIGLGELGRNKKKKRLYRKKFFLEGILIRRR